MKPSNSQKVPTNRPGAHWPWLLVMGIAFLTLVVVLRPRHRENRAGESAASSVVVVRNSATPSAGTATRRTDRPMRPGRTAASVPARPAEEVVAEKVNRFARDRETLVAAMAKHYKTEVPEVVNRFFAAVQTGQWEATTNLFASLMVYRTNSTEGFQMLWQAIKETQGVAEAAHNWPAQQLLDYGNAILGSLRPGMVYVGGNDAGQYIPALLNETSGGDAHIVVSQNALADVSYLEYLRYRFGDRLNVVTPEDSQKNFASYIADAQKRFQHDQEFQDSPRQIRPGEDIRVTEDGRVQVAGQVAVMAINEQLLQTLLQKNPNLSFALVETFPLQSFYAGATTLGPVTELRADATPLSQENAAQSVDYWRATTPTVLSDPATTDASRNAYTKLILGQANLFYDRKLTDEAGQAYQLANQLSPANPEAVFFYLNLLMAQARLDEAKQMLQVAVNLTPDNREFRDILDRLKSQ